jgi:hypothetical protein
MTGKQGMVGGFLVQHGGQIMVRVVDGPAKEVRLEVQSRPKPDIAQGATLLLTPGEVDNLIRILQEARQ